MQTRASRRKLTGRFVELLASLAALLALFLLASILWTLVARGLPALSLHTLTTSMAPTGENGGLANAVVGSLIQIGLGMLIAVRLVLRWRFIRLQDL